jgi:hypothetical protein
MARKQAVTLLISVKFPPRRAIEHVLARFDVLEDCLVPGSLGPRAE